MSNVKNHIQMGNITQKSYCNCGSLLYSELAEGNYEEYKK